MTRDEIDRALGLLRILRDTEGADTWGQEHPAWALSIDLGFASEEDFLEALLMALRDKTPRR